MAKSQIRTPFKDKIAPKPSLKGGREKVNSYGHIDRTRARVDQVITVKV